MRLIDNRPVECPLQQLAKPICCTRERNAAACAEAPRPHSSDHIGKVIPELNSSTPAHCIRNQGWRVPQHGRDNIHLRHAAFPFTRNMKVVLKPLLHTSLDLFLAFWLRQEDGKVVAFVVVERCWKRNTNPVDAGATIIDIADRLS